MNQLEGVDQPRVEQPGVYNIILNVQTQGTKEIGLEMKINPDVKFNIFIEMVKKVVFAQEMPKFYEEQIVYMHGQDTIEGNETRTLKQLGFKPNSILIVRLKLKGG